MVRVDRWLGVALIVLALAWLRLVYAQIPDAGGEWPGPRGFPLLLGVVLAVLGAWMTVVAAADPRPEPVEGRGARPTYAGDPRSPRHEFAVASGTFGVLLLYAFLLERVGFLVGTPVVIALAMGGLLRMRRWVPVLSLATGFTAGCWVIFEALLGTPLPRGSWVVW